MTTPAPQRPSTPADAPDAARLGNPSFVWRSGQERRVRLMERYVAFNGRRVLDLGCGLGEYVRAFARLGADAIGSDVAVDRLVEARKRVTDAGATGIRGFFAAAGGGTPAR